LSHVKSGQASFRYAHGDETFHFAGQRGPLAMNAGSLSMAAGSRFSLSRSLDTVAACWALTKPKLSSLAVFTVLLGYLASPAARDGTPVLVLALAIIGAALAGFGAAALNQAAEGSFDSRMQRTCTRPVPSGRISRPAAFLCGTLLAASGVALLLWQVNLTAAALAAATVVLYAAVYTPLKRRTVFCTEIGAVAGALPPLIGWSASGAPLGLDAWLLFAILFLWQLPHFHPIAFRYRHQYAAAGFRMLACADDHGDRATLSAILYAVVLLPVSLLPTVLGFNSLAYAAVAAIFGTLYLLKAIAFRASPDRMAAARRLFRYSLVYLPLLLSALVADRWLLG
jgi:heme o synthase